MTQSIYKLINILVTASMFFLFGLTSGQKLINNCKPGYVALTFDDGPYTFTSELVDILGKNNVKATFFVNGENYINIRSEVGRAAITKVYKGGHQIGSHTWSHANLVGLPAEKVKEEVISLEDAIYDIIRERPSFLRPPFGAIDDFSAKLVTSYGYSIVEWSTDTKDYDTHDLASEMKNVRDSFNKTDIGQGFIVLAHEVFNQTVSELTQTMIDYTKQQGFKFATVAECEGTSPYK